MPLLLVANCRASARIADKSAPPAFQIQQCACQGLRTALRLACSWMQASRPTHGTAVLTCSCAYERRLPPRRRGGTKCVCRARARLSQRRRRVEVALVRLVSAHVRLRVRLHVSWSQGATGELRPRACALHRSSRERSAARRTFHPRRSEVVMHAKYRSMRLWAAAMLMSCAGVSASRAEEDSQRPQPRSRSSTGLSLLR